MAWEARVTCAIAIYLAAAGAAVFGYVLASIFISSRNEGGREQRGR